MSTPTIPQAKFRLGRIVVTPNALESLKDADIHIGIQRHQAGDWGDVKGDTCAANERALLQGSRIISAYNGEDNTRFWIITEADRSITTVLLPEDY
jgi:hypothetical protein